METLSQLLLEKTEKINEELAEIKVILARQEENIAFHIKRTDIAEANLEMLRAQLAPIAEHVRTMELVRKGSLFFVSRVLPVIIALVALLYNTKTLP